MIRLAVIIFALSAPAAPADTLTVVRLVRANAVIAATDLAVSASMVPGALAGDVDIAGLEAKVTLYPGQPIRPGDIGPAALVERNQRVRLVYRKGGLAIFAEARSLSRGAPGDVVKAINLSSRTTVFGLVEADGTVSVSF